MAKFAATAAFSSPAILSVVRDDTVKNTAISKKRPRKTDIEILFVNELVIEIFFK
tara:strand:- start:422 stop:586 length:165 start_codon:yes stop_codon:yes gene_type:complete